MFFLSLKFHKTIWALGHCLFSLCHGPGRDSSSLIHQIHETQVGNTRELPNSGLRFDKVCSQTKFSLGHNSISYMLWPTLRSYGKWTLHRIYQGQLQAALVLQMVVRFCFSTSEFLTLFFILILSAAFRHSLQKCITSI